MVPVGKKEDWHIEKVQKEGRMKALLGFLEYQTKPFLLYYFVSKDQAKAYNKCRQDATEVCSSKIMIQMDFSENFFCCY